MNDIVSQVKYDIESYLMEDMENQEMRIDFILINPKNNDTISIISDGYEKIIEFTPYTKEMKNGLAEIPEWDYNFDEYFFKELQNGYDIGFISDDTHYNLWTTIDELYPEDIDNKNGVQKYLQYCKDNNITRDYIDDVMKLSVPDVMKNYEYPDGLMLK